MKLLFCAFLLLLLQAIYALPVALSTDFIDFGSLEIYETQTQTISITNTYDSFQIINISSQLDSVIVSDSLLYLSPGESHSLEISFTGITNIHYKSAILFTNQLDHLPVYMPFSAMCFLPDDEFSTTFNLFDNELKNEILQLVDNHNVINYYNARLQMFSFIENVDGFVECVYTGILVETDGIPNQYQMNTEHAWPQSMGATGIASSDLHILFPSNSTANNRRSNYPYGTVLGTPIWENGGSKLGFGVQGLVRFEPRDSRKGELARSLFYFAIRYDNPFSPFFDGQESILRQWNRDFDVTEREVNRNNAIESIQEKKNPFVVHPYFAERIYSLSNDNIAPEIIDLIHPELIIIESYTVKIPLFNNGNRAINITEIQKNSQNFEILSFPHTLLPSDVGIIELVFLQMYENVYSIEIITDKGVYEINMSDTPTSLNDEVIKVSDFTIYPNPIRDSFRITTTKDVHAKIEIYNIRGQKVYYDYISENYNQVVMPLNLSAGVYFLKIENERNNFVKRVLYIK